VSVYSVTDAVFDYNLWPYYRVHDVTKLKHSLDNPVIKWRTPPKQKLNCPQYKQRVVRQSNNFPRRRNEVSCNAHATKLAVVDMILGQNQ